jgi:hypothetical protein
MITPQLCTLSLLVCNGLHRRSKDNAAPLLFQKAMRMFRAQERTAQIRIENRIPIVQSVLFSASITFNAGVIAKHIDPPEDLHRSLYHCFNFSLYSDVCINE